MLIILNLVFFYFQNAILQYIAVNHSIDLNNLYNCILQIIEWISGPGLYFLAAWGNILSMGKVKNSQVSESNFINSCSQSLYHYIPFY